MSSRPMRPAMASFVPPEVSTQSTIVAQVQYDVKMPDDRIRFAEKSKAEDIIGTAGSALSGNTLYDVHPNEPVFVMRNRQAVATTSLIDTRKAAWTSFNGYPIRADIRVLPPKRKQRAFDREVMFLGIASTGFLLSSATQAQYGGTVFVGGSVPIVPRREAFVAGYYGTVETPRVDYAEREKLQLYCDENYPLHKQLGVLRHWDPYGGVSDIRAAVDRFLMNDDASRHGFEMLDPQSTFRGNLDVDDELALRLARAVLASAGMTILACIESGLLQVAEWADDDDAVRTWRDSLTEQVDSRGYDAITRTQYSNTGPVRGFVELDQVAQDAHYQRVTQVMRQLGLVTRPNGTSDATHTLKRRALGLALHAFLEDDSVRDVMDVMSTNPNVEAADKRGFIEESDAWKQLRRVQENGARDWIRVATESFHLNAERCHVKAVHNAPIGVVGEFILTP